jgi:hypothetical protein
MPIARVVISGMQQLKINLNFPAPDLNYIAIENGNMKKIAGVVKQD